MGHDPRTTGGRGGQRSTPAAVGAAALDWPAIEAEALDASEAADEFTKGQLVTVNLGGLHGRLGVVEFGAVDDRGSKRYSVRMGPAWRHFAQAEDLTRLTWPDDVIERVKAHMAAVWRVVL